MAVPGADAAFVPNEKLVEYLLNDQHPVGASKAKWFHGLGYELARAIVLEQDLLAIVRTSEDYEQKASSFGTKYIVNGKIAGPNGIQANVTTVWIVEPHESKPRLVTAYPGAKK